MGMCISYPEPSVKELEQEARLIRALLSLHLLLSPDTVLDLRGALERIQADIDAFMYIPF